METIHYRAADVNGLKISYREAGRTTLRQCSCCTGFRLPGTCSAI